MHNFLLTDDGRVLHFRNNTWIQVNRMPMDGIRFCGLWTPRGATTMPRHDADRPIRTGDCFTASVDGVFNGYQFRVGDTIVATMDSPPDNPSNGWSITSTMAMTDPAPAMGAPFDPPISVPMTREATQPFGGSEIFGPASVPMPPVRSRPTTRSTPVRPSSDPIAVSSDIVANTVSSEMLATALAGLRGSNITAAFPATNGSDITTIGRGVTAATTTLPNRVNAATVVGDNGSALNRWAEHISASSRSMIALPSGFEIQLVKPTGMADMWGYLFALLQDGEYVQVERAKIGTIGLFNIVLFTATHQETVSVTEVEDPQQAVTMVADGLVKLRSYALLPPAAAEPVDPFPAEPALEDPEEPPADRIRGISANRVLADDEMVGLPDRRILDENGDEMPF